MEVNGINLNDTIKNEVMVSLIGSILKEELMQKDIAEQLDISPPEISWIKSKGNWRNVKDSTWWKLTQWKVSGSTLKEYMKKFSEVSGDVKEVEKKEEVVYTDESISKAAGHILSEVEKSKKQDLLGQQDLLEQGELKLQDDEEIKTIQFHQRMKECWDELESRGTVEKFLRSRGYTGILNKVITKMIELKI
jgi:hypothetical protein